MRRLKFVKYEGLGNDFVIVDLADLAELSPDSASRICDRRFGVGADGVIVVLPPSDENHAARMVVLNADGSRPEMCGNGLRCVALHLALRQQADVSVFQVETDAGVLSCEVERSGEAALVTAEMGQAVLAGDHRDPESGFQFALVSTGNPHAVTFQSEFDEQLVDRVGPAVSATQPKGANVEFAERVEGGFRVIVWERGVGRTMACGTGAVATAVAACQEGYAAFDQPIEVTLPGGSLEVTVRKPELVTSLRGPARKVFVGEMTIS